MITNKAKKRTNVYKDIGSTKLTDELDLLKDIIRKAKKKENNKF